MGESLLEDHKVENKMGESFTTIPCLQESVSFGRFEHDSLCWERWSTFPTNKYLEEVEKCSTPGSVAQKKAYFEAHYKRIAARKAEWMDQEKKREEEAMNVEDQSPLGSMSNTRKEEFDLERSNTQNSVDETEMLNEVGKFSAEMSDKYIDIPGYTTDIVIEENGVVDLWSEVSEHDDELSDGIDVTDEVNEVADIVSEHIDEQNVEANVAVEKVHIQHIEEQELTGSELVKENKDIQPQAIEEVGVAREMRDIQPENIDESNCGTDMIKKNKDIQPQVADASEDLFLKTEIPHSVKPDKPVLLDEDITSAGVWQDKEVLPQETVEERKISKKETKTTVKLVDPMKIKKTTLAKKTIDTTTTKKKPVSSIPRKPVASKPKSTMISTPKSSKPESTKSAKSTIRPSVKKENGHTPLTSKKVTKPEGKRVLSTSLHMSLCYGPADSAPANSDPAPLTTMRKSLIMERMGDKDIVKRAFKAFQNINQLTPSSLQKPTATNKSASKKIEVKATAPDTFQKTKQGAGKATSPITGVQVKASQSPGLKKSIGVDQRNGKAVPVSLGSRNGKYAPASFGSRSLDQGRQQREVPKELEPKTDMKDAEKIYLHSKLKAAKTTDIGKPARSINSKPKLSSSFNQGHGYLRGSVHKVDAKR